MGGFLSKILFKNVLLCFADITKCIALLSLPIFLSEKKDKFYRERLEDKDTDDEPVEAYICWKGDATKDETTFSIRLEKQEVCNTKSLVRAFLLLTCVYYVFNLKYMKGTTSTLHFLQRVLLDIDDGTVNTDTKLLGFLSKVNKL